MAAVQGGQFAVLMTFGWRVLTVEGVEGVHSCRLIAGHFPRWLQSTHCDLEHPPETSPLLSANTSLRTACVPQGRHQLEAKFDSKCQQRKEEINSFPVLSVFGDS